MITKVADFSVSSRKIMEILSESRELYHGYSLGKIAFSLMQIWLNIRIQRTYLRWLANFKFFSILSVSKYIDPKVLNIPKIFHFMVDCTVIADTKYRTIL
jgi:hypothetical protein